MMVDDYTRRRLFNHDDGRALSAHEEMSALFDTIQKRQLEWKDNCTAACMMRESGLSQVLKYSLLIAINATCSPQLSFPPGYQKQEAKQQQLDKVCLCIAGTTTFHSEALSFTEKISVMTLTEIAVRGRDGGVVQQAVIPTDKISLEFILWLVVGIPMDSNVNTHFLMRRLRSGIASANESIIRNLMEMKVTQWETSPRTRGRYSGNYEIWPKLLCHNAH